MVGAINSRYHNSFNLTLELLGAGSVPGVVFLVPWVGIAEAVLASFVCRTCIVRLLLKLNPLFGQLLNGQRFPNNLIVWIKRKKELSIVAYSVRILIGNNHRSFCISSKLPADIS